MSRGFVKEDDQEDIPFIAPRAYLPPGTINYFTPTGMEALMSEREALISEKNQWHGHNENERRVANNYLNARLQLLDERIVSARVVKLNEQPKHEVRFGATVTIKDLHSNNIQTIQITGVDEANPVLGKISFISPLAHVLTNKKIGDEVQLKRKIGEIKYLIEQIEYK